MSSNKDPKKPAFSVVIKRGSVVVKIYLTPTNGCESYTISYWRAEKRHRESFAEFARAKKEADKVATRLTARHYTSHLSP